MGHKDMKVMVLVFLMIGGLATLVRPARSQTPVSGAANAANSVSSAPAADSAAPASSSAPAGASGSASSVAPEAPSAPAPTFTPIGYVEAGYQFNTNRPSNGVSNYRLDNRHSALGLYNIALGGTWSFENITGKVVLQAGQTPSTYYAGEPIAVSASGVAGTDATYWRFVQEAWAGYKFNVGKGLLLQAGLFLSPIGYEVLAVKDNWNATRTNLFYGLPFYHTCVRGTQSFSEKLGFTAGVCNGWNSVSSDNNAAKSVYGQLAYADGEALNWSVLYFGGPERTKGAAEGQPWRSDVDFWINATVADPLALGAHGNVGFEKNAFGSQSWIASAGYARLKLKSWFYIAARGDIFYEKVPSSNGESAASIFFPASTVYSQTITLDFRPGPNAGIILEGRRDKANKAMYFKGEVTNDVTTGLAISNAKAQNTVTAMFNTWF